MESVTITLIFLWVCKCSEAADCWSSFLDRPCSAAGQVEIATQGRFLPNVDVALSYNIWRSLHGLDYSLGANIRR